MQNHLQETSSTWSISNITASDVCCQLKSCLSWDVELQSRLLPFCLVHTLCEYAFYFRSCNLSHSSKYWHMLTVWLVFQIPFQRLCVPSTEEINLARYLISVFWPTQVWKIIIFQNFPMHTTFYSQLGRRSQIRRRKYRLTVQKSWYLQNGIRAYLTESSLDLLLSCINICWQHSLLPVIWMEVGGTASQTLKCCVTGDLKRCSESWSKG